MRNISILAIFLLSGCAMHDSLYFGSYTRIGIEASSDGGGIGAKNAAFNITPPKKDGSAFNVLGTSDLDISYTETVIHETFAVGEAAKCAAYRNAIDREEGSSLTEETPPKIGPVIFGTYSSWSLLDLSWGNSTSTGINFGYKRGTGVKMPIVNDQIGSVYASISVNTTTGGTVAPGTNIGGTRNMYTFATGDAAIIRASQEAAALNGGDETYNGCLGI